MRLNREPQPRPIIEYLEQRLQLSTVDVTNFRYDSGSSGVNSSEVQLTPSNVKVNSFGKVGTVAVDGAVYAEPLVKNSVTIASGVNTSAGAAGVHNVVFVATQNGSIYAIDAQSAAVLWKRSMLGTNNTGGNINNTLNATSIVSLNDADVGLPNSSELWDLTGTPVIDNNANVLYVVVRTKETISGATHYVQRLHALNLSDGTDAATPYMIGDTSGGYVNNTPIYVYGTGDGAVTDPYNGTGKQVVQFNARRELQRPALNLVNNTVYVAWASNGDNGPYHGFIAKWNIGNIKTTGFQLSGVLCTSPNNGEAGIWEGGGGLAFESNGSAFYAMTGNGTSGPPTLGGNGLPTSASYNEAVIKVVSDGSSSATNQNPNGWGMKITDFFIPYNVQAMDNADSDFGSGGPLILPPSAGIAGHPDLLIAGGKDGRIFVLDRDDLGGYNSTSDAALNAVPNGSGANTPPTVIAGTLSTPVYYNGKLYIVGGYLGNAKAFTISSVGKLVPSSSTKISNFGSLPDGPTVSSNGATNGIVWLVDLNSNALRAYNSSSLSTELWDSTQAAGNSDALGAGIKLSEPTVDGGEVFVGTQNSLVIYGLTPPAGAVPNKPVLTATTLSGSSINLTWTDSTVSPNLASGYIVQDSTDGTNFTQVTTAPAGATSIAIGALTASTTYYFRIEGFNVLGNSPFSDPAMAMTDASGGTSNPVSPNAPTGLGATPASGTSVFLTWTANSTNETGYHLDRATDAGFTQNLITENIADTDDTSYTDTASGLAPGLSFFYRLRAYNTAGDSGNSNEASADIPTVPPKPTNQGITNVTTNEIDITWQDNAGHLADGYRILRAVNHGGFDEIVSLPPTSRPAPSEYDWDDTDVTPGNFYEYHIQAYNVAGNNDFAGVNATSITSAPTDVAAINETGDVSLSWPAVMGAVTYNIYRGDTPGGESGTPIAMGVVATNFKDMNVAAGTIYYYKVSAVNGNATFVPPLPSESAQSAEATQEDPSTTTIALSASAISAGDSLTFTATVSPTSGTGATPGGTVTFLEDGNAIGSAVTLVNGIATLTTTALTDVGQHAITANYHGDAVYVASQSPPAPLSIFPAYSDTLTLSADTIGLGSSVTFTDSLAPATDGALVPTGTVTFFANGVSLGTIDVASDGTGIISTSSLPAGNLAITAQYSGDGNYAGRTTAPSVLVVRNTPQSVTVPAIDDANAPASVVAGSKGTNFTTPVTIDNPGTDLNGVFTITLYAATGDALDGTETLLGTSHKHAKLGQGKSLKMNFHVKNFAAKLAAGNYHLVTQVIDPAGNSSVSATSQTIAVGPAVVNLSVAVGAITPNAIAVNKSGVALIQITNTGNVAATGKLDLILGAIVDPTAPPSTQLIEIKKSMIIGAGKAKAIKVKFKTAGTLAAGTYYPTASVTLAGVSATTVATYQFTVS